MLQYETVFFTDPTLPDEDVEELLRAYEQHIGAAGGKILKVERWGKRRLAYPVERFEEAFYILMVIECPAEFVKELDRRFRLNDRVLRHLTVRVENEAQLGPSPMMKTRSAERDEAASEPSLAP